MNFGGGQVPRVLMDLRRLSVDGYKDLRCIGHFYLPEPDKWSMNDLGTDYIYTGDRPIPFMLPNGLKEVVDFGIWTTLEDRNNKTPLFQWEEWLTTDQKHAELNFVKMTLKNTEGIELAKLSEAKNVVILLDTDNKHAMAEQRRFFFRLLESKVEAPVVILRKYA